MRALFRKELTALDMGLEARLANNVSLLSGGQRQALTLLMTVMSRPALILLDEHAAALDPRNAAKVLELTKRFIEEYRLTAVMITHNMAHAIEYGNRLLMMDAGEIILDIEGGEKKELTVEKLVQRFHAIRRKEFGNDKALLA
jgi:putative ABC transport system ATP-binding protein